MSQFPSNAPAGAAVAATAQSQPTVCFSCGYSLEGLPIDGLCPECGLPIARSFADDQLVNSAPEYIQKLLKGTTLILTYLLGYIIVTFGVIVLAFAGVGQFMLISVLLNLALAGLSAYAWWMFSEPDIKLQFHAGQQPRKLVRIAVITTVAVGAINFLGTMVSGEFANGYANLTRGAGSLTLWTLLSIIVGLAGLAAYAVHFFASMLYIRWLAPRIPDEKIYKRAKQFMWLGPVLYTVGSLVCGLGPLVALILYYNMINDVRKHLKRISNLQSGQLV